jgi:HSP20 family protein
MKDLIPFEQLKEFLTIRDEIDKMFDRYFVKSNDQKQLSEIAWIPPIDVEETDEEIIVKIEIPSMKKEDIKISIQNEHLIVEGDKKQMEEEIKRTYHRIERPFGKFKRVVAIPYEVKVDNVKAIYVDGLLTICMTKTEATKPVTIPINIK